MPFHNVHEYLALPRPDDAWIVQDVLPTGGYLNMYGKAKAGKSVLALQLASAIATEGVHDWMGFPIIRHGPVCYLQVDTPRPIWAERLENALRHVPLEGVYFVDLDESGLPYPFNILGEGSTWLTGALAAMPVKPLLLIVDTIREIHDQEENSSSEMKRVVSMLRAAARDPAIMILSHSRKSQIGTYAVDMMDENRGSGYIAGRMDTIIQTTDKLMQMKGRALEEQTVAIQFNKETLLFSLADDFHARAVELVTGRRGESLRELARQLHTMFPKKGEETCWSKIRRVAKATESRGKLRLATAS